MKNLKKEISLLAASLHGRNGHIIVMVFTIALFLLSAGAPNATIGIGK